MGKKQPLWAIANREGNVAKINGEELKPVYSGEKCVKDYFMIIKAQNIHPAAKDNVPCLVLAGCHGPGTSAAGLALKKLEVLKEIDQRSRGYFQAIGETTIQRRKPKEDSIRLLDVIPLY